MVRQGPDDTNKFLKPAPHIRRDGTVAPPVGSLRQMLHRAFEKPRRRNDEAIPERLRDAFVNSLRGDPAFAREVLGTLRGLR